MHGKLRQPRPRHRREPRLPRRRARFPAASPRPPATPVPVPGRVWHPALAGPGDRRPRRDGDGPCRCPIPERLAGPRRGINQRPAATGIRQDLEGFDSEFGLTAARIQVVTSLAGSASRWQASGEEVEDTAMVHAVAPTAAATTICARPGITGTIVRTCGWEPRRSSGGRCLCRRCCRTRW